MLLLLLLLRQTQMQSAKDHLQQRNTTCFQYVKVDSCPCTACPCQQEACGLNIIPAALPPSKLPNRLPNKLLLPQVLHICIALLERRQPQAQAGGRADGLRQSVERAAAAGAELDSRLEADAVASICQHSAGLTALLDTTPQLPQLVSIFSSFCDLCHVGQF